MENCHAGLSGWHYNTGDSKYETVSTTEILINSSKNMSLGINKDKTKYLVMSRIVVSKTNLKVEPY